MEDSEGGTSDQNEGNVFLFCLISLVPILFQFVYLFDSLFICFYYCKIQKWLFPKLIKLCLRNLNQWAFQQLVQQGHFISLVSLNELITV